MHKLNLIIIEDEFFAGHHLKKELLKLGHQVEKIIHSGEEFIRIHNQLNFDAAIVDIQLSGEINGFDIAAILNKLNRPFIFLTANEEKDMIIQATKFKPTSYISKPFKINDIIAGLELISVNVSPLIKIRTKEGVKFLDSNSIRFIKADSSYIEIQTEHKSFIQRKLLKDFMSELPTSFIRIHRSYVVNKNKITAQNSKYVCIEDHKIPISRGYNFNAIEINQQE